MSSKVLEGVKRVGLWNSFMGSVKAVLDYTNMKNIEDYMLRASSEEYPCWPEITHGFFEKTASHKELVIEKKEMLQAKTSDYFERTYFTETLNIPQEYVEGFLFYIAENLRYAQAMKDKNMERLNVLRMLSAALTNELVYLQKTPTDTLEDPPNKKRRPNQGGGQSIFYMR